VLAAGFPCQPDQASANAARFAPTGRRAVATGAAKSAGRRTQRNPWMR
jgi:hypothetical protein